MARNIENVGSSNERSKKSSSSSKQTRYTETVSRPASSSGKSTAPSSTPSRSWGSPRSEREWTAPRGGSGRSGMALSAPVVKVEKPKPSDEEVKKGAESFSRKLDSDRAKNRENAPSIDVFEAILGKANKFFKQNNQEGNLPEGLGGKTLPNADQAKARQATRVAQQVSERETALGTFTQRGKATVRELTNEEWAALSPEQQKGVIANFAVYQAAQQDRELNQKAPKDEDYTSQVKAIFGDKGGSKRYAPNTVRVLSELGYNGANSDLDLFLGGEAIANSSDVGRYKTKPENMTGALSVFDQLATSVPLNNETLNAQLQKGAQLLDAIRSTGSLSPETTKTLGFTPGAEALSDQQKEGLSGLFSQMSSKSAWDKIQSDPELSTVAQEDLAAYTKDIDPNAVYDYFMSLYDGYNGDPNYMTPEEFSQNWFEK